MLKNLVLFLVIFGTGSSFAMKNSFEPTLISYQQLMRLDARKRVIYLKSVVAAINEFEIKSQEKLAGGKFAELEELRDDMIAYLAVMPEAMAAEDDQHPNNPEADLDTATANETALQQQLNAAQSEIQNHSNVLLWNWGPTGRQDANLVNTLPAQIQAAHQKTVEAQQAVDAQKAVDKQGNDALAEANKPPEPPATGAVNCSFDKHAIDKARAGYKKSPGNKKACLIGGSVSSYQGGTPKAGKCKPITCSTSDVPNPSGKALTKVDSSFVCKKDKSAICLPATKTVFADGINLAKTQPDKYTTDCVTRDGQNHENWSDVTGKMATVCDKTDPNTSVLFCQECKTLEARLASASSAAGVATPAVAAPAAAAPAPADTEPAADTPAPKGVR
jgi:hypothetical protein